MTNDFYVYEYIRLDYGEPFYIGKGRGDRWRCSKSRNKYFTDVCKNREVAVVILHDNLTETEAHEIECWYIWQLRDELGYWLTNQTDGGEGGSIYSYMSKEELKRYRIRMSKIVRGRVHSEESRRKISKALTGRKFSEEHRRRISESMKGGTLTERHKAHLSSINSGEGNPMYGKFHSEDTKRKIGEGNRKRVKVIDSSGRCVKKFRSSRELTYSDWRLQFPRPNGINHVRRCLTHGLDFHGHSIIHDIEEANK